MGIRYGSGVRRSIMKRESAQSRIILKIQLGEVLHILRQRIKGPLPGSSAEFAEDPVLSCEICICARFQFHTTFSDESVGPVPGCWQVTGPGVVHSSTCAVRSSVHGCRQIIPGVRSRWLMVSQWRPLITPNPQNNLGLECAWNTCTCQLSFESTWLGQKCLNVRMLKQTNETTQQSVVQLWAWVTAEHSQVSEAQSLLQPLKQQQRRVKCNNCVYKR